MNDDDIEDLRDTLDRQDNNPTGNYNEWLIYETGDLKTVDFQMLDGTRQHFNYSHYIKAWIGQDEENTPFIRVFFSTDTVTINGFCLDQLYNALRNLNVTAVRANSERYAKTMTINENDTFVTDITIEKHGGGQKTEQG